MTDIDNTDYDSDTPVLPEAFANSNLSDEDKSFLQKEIERARNDAAAVVAEFKEAASKDPVNGLVDAAKKRLSDALPDALDNIIATSKLGGTESIRFQASKYIADLCLGKTKSGGTDPKEEAFKDFVNGILNGDGEELPKSTELQTEKGSDG